VTTLRRLAAAAVIVGLVGAFAASATLIAISDAPWMRANGYAHSRSCLHALQTSGTPRRVLILGSSRMRQALDPSRMARARGLPDDTVVNLGRPDRDVGVDADQLEAMAATARPDLVVVELHAGSGRLQALERSLDPGGDGRVWRFGRDHYSQGALLLRPLASLVRDGEGLGAIARLHAAAGIVAWRLNETFSILAARAWFDPRRPSPETDPARGNLCAMTPDVLAATERPDPAADAQAAAFAATFDGWETDASDFLSAPQREADRRAVRRMAALSRRHGFRLVFLYLPSRRTPLPDAALVEAFRRETGAELIVPPRALIDDLDRRGRFYDNAHLTTTGGAEFTDWFEAALDADAR
jgi:hypothetical protein